MGGLYVAVMVATPALPAASRAVRVRMLSPDCKAIVLTAQLLVPVAVPDPPRLLVHVTCVTPTLSLAVPLRPSELAVVV